MHRIITGNTLSQSPHEDTSEQTRSWTRREKVFSTHPLSFSLPSSITAGNNYRDVIGARTGVWGGNPTPPPAHPTLGQVRAGSAGLGTSATAQDKSSERNKKLRKVKAMPTIN